MFELADISKAILATEHTGETAPLEQAVVDYDRLKRRINSLKCKETYPQTHAQMLTAVSLYEDGLKEYMNGNENQASAQLKLGTRLVESLGDTLAAE
jgi:hypothetical protein